jgi:phosphate transport system substrate-binding protein
MKSLANVASLAAVAALALAVPARAQVRVDPSVKPYEPVSGISGNLAGVGSDTLNNMMVMWMEEFRKLYPNVTTSYKGEGSGTAPPALIQGTAQLGPMSRPMKPEEIDAIRKKYGFEPTTVNVAVDCVAVFVSKDNPVKGLTIPQLDCIYSSTRKSGYRDIATWGGAGLKGVWASRPIDLYGRNSVSGTYALFKEEALYKGDCKPTVKELPGSAAVVDAVAKDLSGVGYSGIGYVTSDVRALPLAKDHESPLAEPTFDNAISGKYPLGRTLTINVLKKPGEPLPPLVAEFMKFVLSRQGQEVVVKDGFGPLPAAVIEKELARLK